MNLTLFFIGEGINTGLPHMEFWVEEEDEYEPLFETAPEDVDWGGRRRIRGSFKYSQPASRFRYVVDVYFCTELGDCFFTTF